MSCWLDNKRVSTNRRSIKYMEQLEELIEKIEALRNYLHELMEQKDINSPDILKASQQLDQFLVEYHELIKNRD